MTAVDRLGWISHPIALDYLAAALTLPLSAEVCDAIITSLGRVKSPALRPKAAHILINLVTNSLNSVIAKTLNPALVSPKMKQAIAVGLGQLGQAIAIELLQELLADANQAVRLHGSAALKYFEVSDSRWRDLE